MNDPSPSPVDLDHTSACLATALRRASRTLSAAYDRALAGAGLSASQFILLKCLAEMGPVSIKSLAASIGIDRTTLSRTVSYLARCGLITESAGNDRRVKWLSVSPKGRAAIERAEADWLDVQTRIVTALGSDRTAALLAQLTEIANAASLAAPRGR